MKLITAIATLFTPTFPAGGPTQQWYKRQIDSAKVEESQMLNEITNKMVFHSHRYIPIQNKTGVPWELVAAIHYLESRMDFRRNLFNGQPWKEKTTKQPVGLGPWRSWEESAIEAMSIRTFKAKDITLESMLEYAEAYNGMGYYNRKIFSPYLWAGTNKYKKGLFIHDYVFDADGEQKVPGLYAILMDLSKKTGKAYGRAGL